MTAANPIILLIDDDDKLAHLLHDFFAQFNLTLHSESLPSKGLKKYQTLKPDLVILDVMLPEMDGFEVCRRLRNISNTPIIMLSARGEVGDRVVGLESGADDYLPKPFEPRELLARIEQILSRVEKGDIKHEPEMLHFKQISINKSSYEVKVLGKTVTLTTKEYTLLMLMTSSPSRVFSRDEIMNELSGIDSELFSRSVDILVSRLRNKLKPVDCIETVWGSGYRFNDK